MWMSAHVILIGVLVVVEAEPEQMHIPASLVVRYTPPVSAAVSKNHKIEIEFHARLNLTELLDTDGVTLDADYIPIWLRCPGRLMAVAEPNRLLEILNDTIDVIPMDFVAGVSTVLVLCGKELGHVRLVLYWELTNASLCFEWIDGNDSVESVTTTAMAIRAIATSAGHDVPLEESVSTTRNPGSRETETEKTEHANKTTVLDKTFVVVRGSRRSRRSVLERETTKCEVNLNCTQPEDSSKIVIDSGYYVHVLLEGNILEEVLVYTTAIVAASIVFLIGFKVEPNAVKSILRKPIGLIIGFACQLLLMPLISYVLAVAMFKDEKHSQLGLLALGTSPTSVLSNSWVLMLNKNVDLGISLTVISQICAFFLMPLCLKTLGQRILPDVSIEVPWKQLFSSSATVLIPLSIAIMLVRMKTSWANVVAKIDRPAAMILMFIFNCIAIATLWSLLPQTNWTMAFAESVLASFGYLSCWTLAWLCRMERRNIATVSMVTAVRNADVAYTLIQLNVRKPDSDLSSVQLCVHILVTSSLVLLVNFICDTVHRRRHSRCTDLPPRSEMGDKEIAVAEPLIIRAVFSNDARGRTETSYVANEPLTSDIRNQADNVNTEIQETCSTTKENNRPGKILTTFGK